MTRAVLDMKSAFPKAIESVGKLSNRVVVSVENFGHFTMQRFAKDNPNRYFNMGILEPTLVSVCAGLAKEGLIPIGHTIAPFMAERSLEQIKLDFYYQALGGNLITIGSAFEYLTLGCTHHCYIDLGILGPYPNTESCYQSSPNELIALFEQKYNYPFLTYYRMSRASHGEIFENVEFGKIIQVRSGNSITLLASGPQLKTAVDLAEELEEDGKSADVLYCHTDKPFNEETVQNSIAKTGKLFVIEEHAYNGGLASLALRCSRNIPSHRLDYHCIPDVFIRHYGSYINIAEGLGFSAKFILPKVKALF